MRSPGFRQVGVGMGWGSWVGIERYPLSVVRGVLPSTMCLVLYLLRQDCKVVQLVVRLSCGEPTSYLQRARTACYSLY